MTSPRSALTAACWLALLLSIAAPVRATYSLLIADTRSGRIGSIGTSCVGRQQVSRISGIAPGFGAIHAQAQSHAPGRERGQLMLRMGSTPEQVIAAITAPGFDLLAATRQYGVVSLHGEAAGWTGSANMPYAEDRQGTFGDFVSSYQGNILTGAAVLDQLEQSLLQGAGCDLPEVMMLALEAGAANGQGDSRCTDGGIPADAGFLRAVERDGSEIVSLEVVGQSEKGALVALREQLDAWRRTHPCALTDAGVPDVIDGGTDVSRDAGPAVDVRDASARDASARDASARDAGRTQDGAGEDGAGEDGAGVDDAGRDVPSRPAREADTGCALASSSPGWAWPLLLALVPRRRRRTPT